MKEKIDKLIQNQGFTDIYDFCKIRLTIFLKEVLKQNELPWHVSQFQTLLESLKPEIIFPYQVTAQTNFKKLPMSETEKQNLILVLNRFGFELYEYVHQELISYCNAQLIYYQNLSKYYQLKYGVKNVEEMRKNVQNYPFEILEKETDDSEWEMANDMIENYQDDLQELMYQHSF